MLLLLLLLLAKRDGALPASTSAAAEQRKGNPVLNHTQTHTAAFSVVVQKPLFFFSFLTFFLAKICRSSTTATLSFTSCTQSPVSYTFAFFFSFSLFLFSFSIYISATYRYPLHPMCLTRCACACTVCPLCVIKYFRLWFGVAVRVRVLLLPISNFPDDIFIFLAKFMNFSP